MKSLKSFMEGGHPQSNLTKKQRQALASPAARAKPKDKVTLSVPPWDKKKDQQEGGCKTKSRKESVGQTPGDHSYHYLQKAKRLASADGHDYDKLPAYDRTHNKHKDYYDNKARNESVEIDESTNWKGGSKHVSLTRFAAKTGFGLQITQIKPMPGQQKRLRDAYVNMPLKDIPKLIKALQTVLKADPKAQLGDDD